MTTPPKSSSFHILKNTSPTLGPTSVPSGYGPPQNSPPLLSQHQQQQQQQQQQQSGHSPYTPSSRAVHRSASGSNLKNMTNTPTSSLGFQQQPSPQLQYQHQQQQYRGGPLPPAPSLSSAPFASPTIPPSSPLIASSPPPPPISISVYVLIAHTGRQLLFHPSSSDSVASLMQSLVQYTDVATHDQILLCEDGTRVYPNTTFSRYPLLMKGDGKVYLFSRVHLSSHSKPAKVIDVDAYELKLPSLAPPSDHPLSHSTSALIRTLPEFQRSFQHHLEMAQAYISTDEARLRAINSLFGEQRLQIAAVGVAVKNLSSHSVLVSQTYTKFASKFEQEQPVHSNLLATFESDLAKLRDIDLHPALKSNDRNTLLDCVPEGKLRSWFKECSNDLEMLSHKMSKLKALHQHIEKGVAGSESDRFPSSDLDSLEKELAACTQLREEQATMFQILQKDYENATRLIADMVNTPNSTNALDICKALDIQDNNHKSQILPRFGEINQRIRSSMQSFAAVQERVDMYFFKKISMVSQLQSNIRDLGSKTTGYSEALTRQKSMFEQLSNLRTLPAAYFACINEVKRRRRFRRLFLKQTEDAVDCFNKLRDDETPRRDSFLQQYGQSFWREFIPNLSARPPSCDVKVVQDHDGSLPEIEYSPQEEDELDLKTKEERKWRESAPGSEATSATSFQQVHHLTCEDREKELLTQIASLTQENRSLRDQLASFTTKGSLSILSNVPSLSEFKQTLPSDSLFRSEAQEAAIAKMQEQLSQQAQTIADFEKSTAALQAQIQSLQDDLQKANTLLKEKEAAEKEKKLASTPSQSQSRGRSGSFSLQEVCKQCNTNPAFVDPTTGAVHPFCSRNCAKEYDIRRASSLKDRSPSLGPATMPTFSPHSKTSASPSLNSLVAAGSSPPTNPPPFSLTSANLHQECNEKIFTLTQYLTTSQQKLQECQANSADLENKYHKAEQELEQLPILREEKRKFLAKIQELHHHVQSMSVNSALLLKEKEELTIENKQLIKDNEMVRDEREMWKEIGRMRITFTSFAVKDVALFYQNPGGHWVAFNHNCPHRYLSAESRDNIAPLAQGSNFFVGEICFIEKRRAAEGDPAVANPFGLELGTEYFLLTVEFINYN